MFGRLSGRGLSCGHRRDFLAHLCGLCGALASHHGPAARLAANTDGALVSALCEAQAPADWDREPHRCLMRRCPGPRVSPAAPPARFAAAVSAAIGAARIDDHLADRDPFSQLLRPAAGLARSWWRSAGREAARLGFDMDQVRGTLADQLRVERDIGRPFFHYSAPAEAAAGAVCRHTGVLSGQPAHADALEALGRAFGRIIYLLDAWTDLDQDREGGRFNPLAQCFGDGEVRDGAGQIFRMTHRSILDQLTQLRLRQPALVTGLLADELSRTGAQLIENDEASEDPAPDEQPKHRRNRPEDCCDCCAGCGCGLHTCGCSGSGKAADGTGPADGAPSGDGCGGGDGCDCGGGDCCGCGDGCACDCGG